MAPLLSALVLLPLALAEPLLLTPIMAEGKGYKWIYGAYDGVQVTLFHTLHLMERNDDRIEKDDMLLSEWNSEPTDNTG